MISEGDAKTILRLLWDTYPRYRDRHSRRAVRECLKQFFNNRQDLDATAWFIDRVRREVSKTSIAPTNAFVLVEWCASLVEEVAQRVWRWARWGADLLFLEAQALELCVGKSARPSLRAAALARTRKALQRAFSEREVTTTFLENLLARLSRRDRVDEPQRSAVFLGVLAPVCHNDEGLGKPDPIRFAYYNFYVEHIIQARTPVPPHIARALADFFGIFPASVNELREQVLPAVEKALLRTPEVVLQGVTQAFLESIPEDWVSEILQDHLLKPLLSSIRSTNPAVRNGAALTLEVAARRSDDEDIVNQVADEIIGLLKSLKTSGPEQRLLLARVLAAFPKNAHLSKVVPSELCQVVGKETNEAALAAETLAISTHLFPALISSNGAPSSVTAAFIGGLSDKKPAVRKIWSIRLGAMIWKTAPWEIRSTGMLEFIRAMVPELQRLWTEVTSNPLPAVQTGLITAAYVVLAIYQTDLLALKEDGLLGAADLKDVLSDAFPSDHRPSFLLNHRIYTKLQEEEDLDWFLRALASSADQVKRMGDETAAREAWAQGFVYLITSSVVKAVSQRARQLLSETYVEDPAAIGQMIIRGLWKWRQQIELAEKDSAAMASKTGVDRVYLALQSISLRPKALRRLGEGEIDRSILENQLAELLVICRPEVFPHTSWIAACQTVGVDPGDLARKHSKRLLENILQITQVCIISGLDPRAPADLGLGPTARL